MVGPEISYDDLLAGYDSLATQTVLSFAPSPINSMVISTNATAAPWLSQASSAYFPVIFTAPYSARMRMATTAAGSKL